MEHNSQRTWQTMNKIRSSLGNYHSKETMEYTHESHWVCLPVVREAKFKRKTNFPKKTGPQRGQLTHKEETGRDVGVIRVQVDSCSRERLILVHVSHTAVLPVGTWGGREREVTFGRFTNVLVM